VTFSNLTVRLHRTKSAPFQLRASRADSLPLLSDLRQPNEQRICEFIPSFVAVNVRHDDLGCARAINVFDEPSGLRVCSIAYVPEMSQRAVRFSANFFPQPGERLEAIGFSQQPRHRDAMNAPLRGVAVGGQLCLLAPEPGQSPVFRRRFAVLLGTDAPALQVEVIRNQCAVAQPEAVSSAEFAAHGRDFQLRPPVVMPGPLDSCAVNHSVFAQQPAGFVPLPADAVKQSGSVWFFAGENSVLVPGANSAVHATLAPGRLLAELTVSVIMALNGAAHHLRISRETGSWRRECCCSFVTLCDSVNWSRERFLTRFVRQRNCSSASRAATVLDDENLEARALAAAGVSEEERRRARLSDRAVVSLTRSTPPYNRLGSHRAVTASWGRMAGEVTAQGLVDWRPGA